MKEKSNSSIACSKFYKDNEDNIKLINKKNFN